MEKPSQASVFLFFLDQILNRLADYLENSEALKSKVKGAMTYPVVVFAIAYFV